MNEFNESLCMHYTYSLLTGKETYEELLETVDELYLLYNPDRPMEDIDESVYETLLDYYIYTEEYEKCGDIIAAKQLSKLIALN
mgnify:CR=1 FL=1